MELAGCRVEAAGAWVTVATGAGAVVATVTALRIGLVVVLEKVPSEGS